jgi:hypothetical protein
MQSLKTKRINLSTGHGDQSEGHVTERDPNYHYLAIALLKAEWGGGFWDVIVTMCIIACIFCVSTSVPFTKTTI